MSTAPAAAAAADVMKEAFHNYRRSMPRSTCCRLRLRQKNHLDSAGLFGELLSHVI